jgi:hypothetical protein
MQLGKSGRQQYWHWVQLLRDAFLVFFHICRRCLLLEPIPLVGTILFSSLALSFELSHNLDKSFLHWLEVVDLVTFQQVHLIFWMIMLKDSFILQIVAFLVPLLEDKRSLVRSITCWTLSRYSKWIVQVNNILVACWHQLLRPTCLDTVCGFAVIGVQGSLCLVKERLFQDDQ